MCTRITVVAWLRLSQTVRYNLNQRSAARRDGADVSKVGAAAQLPGRAGAGCGGELMLCLCLHQFERNIRDGIREVEAAINNLQADLQIEEDRGLKRYVCIPNSVVWCMHCAISHGLRAIVIRDIVRHRRDVDNLRHELVRVLPSRPLFAVSFSCLTSPRRLSVPAVLQRSLKTEQSRAAAAADRYAHCSLGCGSMRGC